MRDITVLMDHYRIAGRSIWNAAFWSQPELRNWDSWDQFEQIKCLLFGALVVGRLEQIGCCVDLATVPRPELRVTPAHSGSVPILIHRPREGDRNVYWDDPVREVSAADANLHFLDFFDWDKMNYIDFQYYRVRIAAFASQPHLVGREALLQHSHAKVFVNLPSE
jgi:hypothetical protein